jgi:hypothetical protein
MQVVEDPEKTLLSLRVPGDRELIVPEELAENLLLRFRHVLPPVT